ncbi:MAG: hypothetical protein NT061_05085 [Spirochaetes bacterium]|nr:hypothetical protein [Spirochaetota bacterium]
MLAVVLAEDDAFFRSVSHRLRLHRFSIVRYRDPVKLSDNLGELRPELLVVRHEDFPLHGELLASQIFCSKAQSDCSVCVFIPRYSGSDIREYRWPRLTTIEEGEDGPASSQRAFSSYLTSLLASRSEASMGATPQGSRLVEAASRRERSTGS